MIINILNLKNMKKIINQKVYNTKTAIEIAEYRNEKNRSNFLWMQETLYLTKNENWFIYGEGGAMTKYASIGVYRGDGSDIVLLSYNEAFDWVVEHQSDISDSDEIIEKYFNDMISEG